MLQPIRTLAAASFVALSVTGPAFSADDLYEAAKKEGNVSIYAATDQSQAQLLVDAFSKKYPGVRVDYSDLGTNGVYNRIISEAAAKQVGGDLHWTSAMDQSVKLGADGFLDSYRSPELPALPSWALYKDMVYATTIEPVGLIYNKTVLTEAEVPKTHNDLITFFKSKKAQGRVGTFDPEKSGVGFMFQTNDLKQASNFWEVISAFGAAGGKTYSATGAMKETVISGENILSFNLIGSYALDWAKDSSNLGVAFGQDYTAAFSRTAGLIKNAPHPNAGRLFLNFLLSKEGQNAIAAKGMPSVRTDVTDGLNLNTLNARVGGNLRPILLDETRLEYMDPVKRIDFLKKWRAAVRN